MSVVTKADPRIGRLLDGRYRILALIGAGGIGAVYRAEHAALGRFVAVKVLLEEFGQIPELKRRFVREAKALSALSHPHVVPVTDFGLDPEPYLVMELLEGRTLEDLINSGPLAPARALDIARQILRGLAFAHGRGVAHRDLKPANVFLQALPDAQDHVRLLDFGLAKFLDDDRGEADATLTKAGMVFGTPAYMAPEQATGERADARADVYSAGILLYELLTGKRPFNDATRADLMRAHLLTRPPPASETRPGLTLSTGLKVLLDRALAKEPPQRFTDATAMLAALDALPSPAAMIDPKAEAEGQRRAAARAKALSSEETVRATPVLAELPAARQALATAVVRPAGGGVQLRPSQRSWLGCGALVVVGLLMVGTSGYFAVRAIRRHFATEVLPTPPTTPHAPGAGGSQLGGQHAVKVAGGGSALPNTNPTTPTAGVLGGPRARPAARDPWITPGPRTLESARAKIARHAFRRRDLNALSDYTRDTREDPRGHLVLAQGMIELGWRSDALTRYRMAFEADLSVRGDARALDDVADLAMTRGLRARAVRTIHEVWADEAPALLDAAAARSPDPGRQAALRALRVELARMR